MEGIINYRVEAIPIAISMGDSHKQNKHLKNKSLRIVVPNSNDH